MKEIISGIIGFILALVLFHLQEKLKEHRKQNTLIKYLNRELKYNTILMDQWIKDIKQNIYFLKWAKPIYTFTPQFNKFSKIFINKAFDSGIIYDLLDDGKIEFITIIMNYFSEEKQAAIKGFINNYKDFEVVDEDGTPGKELIRMFLDDHLEIVKQNKEELYEIIPLITPKEHKLLHIARSFKKHLDKPLN